MARPSIDDEHALQAVAKLIVTRGLRPAEALRQIVSAIYGHTDDLYRKRAIERLRKKYRKRQAELESGSDRSNPLFPFTILTTPAPPHKETAAELLEGARKTRALAERLGRAQPRTRADNVRVNVLLLAFARAFGKNPD
jgi:hypothetical protein